MQSTSKHLNGVLFIAFYLFAEVICGNIQGIAINNTLTIGYAIPWSHDWVVGPTMGSAVILGVEEVIRRQILPGYQLEWVMRNTKCKPIYGITEMVDLWNSVADLDVIIGDGCSVVCQPLGLLAAAWQIPIISWACADAALSDKNTYPTFTRVSGTWPALAPMFDKLADTFNWTRIGIVTTEEDLMKLTAEATTLEMQRNGKRVFYHLIQSTVDGQNINQENLEKQREIVRVLKEEVRIIYTFMHGADFRNLLISALDEGMLTGEYVFVGIEISLITGRQFDYRPETNVLTYNGVINTKIRKPSSPEYVAFASRVVEELQDPLFASYDHLPATAGPDQVDGHAGMVYDAILLWAYGVNKTMEQGFPPDDGFKVSQNIINTTFQGMTGTVALDQNGDRYMDFTIEMMRDGGLIPMLDWFASNRTLVKLYKAGSPNNWSGLLWHGNSSEIPEDTPHCGWQGEYCSNKNNTNNLVIILVLGLAAILSVVLSISVIFAIKTLKYESDLKHISSMKIRWTDIDKSIVMGKPMVHSSNYSFSSFATAGSNTQKQIFTEIGRYFDNVVAIERLEGLKVNLSDRNTLVDLKHMIDLKHENINPFIGLCIEDPVCILMLYSVKGSLQDILADDSVVLTWYFKLSFIVDIANGMRYLHDSPIKVHGSLTTAKCLVDSRWTCKVSGHGLSSLRCKLKKENRDNGDRLLAKKLWVAPELLFVRSKVDVCSKAADVYSYAMLLYEITSREPIYGTADMEMMNILELVASCHNPPYRPPVTFLSCSVGWKNLMADCWNNAPDKRPSFATIQERISQLNGNRSLNLIDSMITKLESHTNRLEERVQDRSRDLQSEKQKVEFLLFELLPVSVANKLQTGCSVDPEVFDSVTVYVSDLVGFTGITCHSTPIQTVVMLNTMYTLFDDIADSYDVFKVATIGDAYLVASGVPIRNGKIHAVEIFNLAVSLLNALTEFEIPHKPGERLQMRVGIHSGACVAGVAGVKTPRYLLFGDTVEVAGKLESQGRVMEIHISEMTEALLRECDQPFNITSKGEIYVKGKGFIATFYVTQQMY